MNKQILIFLAALTLLFIVGCTNNSINDPITGDAIELTMYKNPSCGCCVGHKAALEQEGYKVNLVQMQDLSPVKSENQIPSEMESCHTIDAGEYFIEGHVPMEAIEKLLKEKPDIDGIALPGMPSGTPGMPGPKRGPYVIYSLKNGEYTEWMTI